MQRLSVQSDVTWATPLIRRLSSYVPLGATELALIEGALKDLRTYPPSSELRFEEVGGARQPVVLVAGWAAASAIMKDGRRQIVALFIPGDIVDPSEMAPLSLTASALTTVRTLEAGPLFAEGDVQASPRIREALLACQRTFRAGLVRHIVRLAALSAYERTADLILDLQERQQCVGLADQRMMSLPLTQEVLSEHVGLSVVHVNRTLQQLRREGLIDYQGGRVIIRDRPRLAAIAARLSQEQEPGQRGRLA